MIVERFIHHSKVFPVKHFSSGGMNDREIRIKSRLSKLKSAFITKRDILDFVHKAHAAMWIVVAKPAENMETAIR